jgi:adenine-specific DNA-methyltransferase
VDSPKTERELIGLALALGAERVSGWTQAETRVAASAIPATKRAALPLLNAIRTGRDPLGDTFCKLRSPEQRRPAGATYTPRQIVSAMTKWAKRVDRLPARVVEPGAGSARFLVAAGRAFADARLIGVELDPVAAILARAHIAAAGFARRAEIIVADFRDLALPAVSAPTLWIGNPPYVRHHQISPEAKQWLTRGAERLRLDASQLAGLHVHFYLATVQKAQVGDYGAFITAAEWLDVNYGRFLRDLFIGPLGGQSLCVIEPSAQPFADAATTAAIACFQIGAKPASVRLRRASSLSELVPLEEGGRTIRRERLQAATRWTPLTRVQRKAPQGYIELGELCRVHRGQVTGSNRVWIAGEHSKGLPDSVLFATVTKGRELFRAEGVLRHGDELRKVIDLPADLDTLDTAERVSVEAFIKVAKKMGADQGYIAQHREAWWAVGLREPAPILASYMARRPPAFVRNLADARHINIAHGLYPREPLAPGVLDRLASFLSVNVLMQHGRTYAGGLTKFEPKEMERLLVPEPAQLQDISTLPFQ